MKKIMITIAAVAFATMAKAATVDWGYTGQATEVGYTVYLYTSEIASSYESFDQLIGSAFASGTVVMKQVGPNKSYKIADNSVASSSLGDTLYYVLVSGSDATTYVYGSSDVSNYIYDPNQQQTSPGALALKTSNFTNSGTIGGSSGGGDTPNVPEPTSGLLMLVGLGALALRRKRA